MALRSIVYGKSSRSQLSGESTIGPLEIDILWPDCRLAVDVADLALLLHRYVLLKANPVRALRDRARDDEARAPPRRRPACAVLYYTLLVLHIHY